MKNLFSAAPGVWANLLLAGFLALFFAIFACAYLGEALTPAAWLLLATSAYGCWRLWQGANQPESAWATQMFWLYAVFVLLVPGLAQLSSASYFWPAWGQYASQDINTAAMILVVGVLVIDAGRSVISQRWGRTKSGTAPVPALEEISQPALAKLLMVAVIWSGVLMSQLGLAFFLRSRGDVELELGTLFPSALLGLAYNLGGGLLTALLLLSFKAWIDTPKPARRVLNGWLLAAAIGLNLLINYPGAQPRFSLLGTLLVLGLIAMQASRWRGWVSWLLTLGFPVVLYSVGRFLGAYNRGSGYDVATAMDTTTDLRGTLHHGDFDGWQMTLAGVRYVGEYGHTWGHQLLGVVLFFVPRSWWPGKALPTGALLGGHEGFDYLNLSAPFPLEAWLDFSWPGVLGLCFLMGGVIGWADQTLQRPQISPYRWLLAATFAALLPVILRGALLAIVGQVATIFFWLLVAAWLSRRSHLVVRPETLRR